MINVRLVAYLSAAALAAVTLLDCLYRKFLGLRLDEGKWKKTTGEMMLWAKEAF